MDKVNKNYQISSKIYELIYELNVIAPNVLLSVLPQLECKLKSGHESERLSKSQLVFSELDDVPRLDPLIFFFLFHFTYRGRLSTRPHVFRKRFYIGQSI